MTDPFSELIHQDVLAVFGADTALVALTPLAGDASSRRYHRARLRGTGVPPSVVVMELPAGSSLPISSEELAVFKEAPKELPFLNVHRFLSGVGVRVPRIYGRREDCGIVLLEDLGDTSLWDRVQNLAPFEVRAWYQKAIDELLILQIRGTERRDDACIAFQQRFDFRLYMWEFEHFVEYGLIKRAGARVTDSALGQFREAFTSIADRLDRQSPCLNHRDFHSWNLMVHEDAVAVIDFQDALLAPPQYDLASLLNDRITDSVVGPEIESSLLEYYRARRAEGEKRNVDADEFVEIYLLSAIQRDFKVVGRFYYLDQVKGKPGYKKFIPATVRRLKRNLARLPQTRRIGELLADAFQEMQ